jgi:hypothetical protein
LHVGTNADAVRVVEEAAGRLMRELRPAWAYERKIVKSHHMTQPLNVA